MKQLSRISFAFLLMLGINSNKASTTTIGAGNGYPEKTVVVKTLASTSMSAYFSDSKNYQFEIFKVGTKADLLMVLASLRKDASVELCELGTLTGDYQQIILKLKTSKNQKWFATLFKNAGLSGVKYNIEAFVSVDNM